MAFSNNVEHLRQQIQILQFAIVNLSFKSNLKPSELPGLAVVVIHDSERLLITCLLYILAHV